MRRPLLLALVLMAAPVSAQSPGASFDAFLASLEAADLSERAALVEMFWEGIAQTPLTEGDAVAVFLWRGEAEGIGLLGDMSEWSETLPLTRLDGTDLWYRRFCFEPEARLEYTFMVDTDAEGFGAEFFGSPDPGNPNRVLSGLGSFSELVMPGYDYPDVFAPVRDGTPGSFEGLDSHTLPPGVLPYEHDILVYTPPGYVAGSAARHPTVYFMDGRDYVEFAHVPAVLDHLIEGGEIEPVVAVFVDPPNRHQPHEPNRMTEYGMNDDFVAFLADELVPFVDDHYRTRPEAAERLIVGDSYGGLIATYVPFRRFDTFGLGHSQSGYHSFQDDRMLRLIEDAPPVPIRLYVDVGTYEGTVGAGLLPAGETDFTAANRRLRDALAAQDYDFAYAEYPEGHTWGNWRAHVIDGLRHFFPAEEH